MAKKINIKIDTSKYVAPTQEDVQAAKDYILRREEYANILGDRVDDLLNDAAEKIVIICYRYGVDPTKLYFSSAFNQEMMKEIGEVMNELEDEVLDLIYEYSTMSTSDRKRINALILWIATLGKGNRNLQQTLEGYMYKMLQDWNAAIAAMMAKGLSVSEAITRIKNYLHNIYIMPEVMEAFEHSNDFTATYIRSKGIQYGARGISNNGSTNVVNMAKNTLQMAWMRDLLNEYQDNEKIALYCVQRGSNFECPICDSHVGIWPIEDNEHFPLFHPHCCCFVFPIYKNEIQ